MPPPRSALADLLAAPDPAPAPAAPAGLPLAEIIRLVEAIAAADPVDQPARLVKAAISMRRAGHCRTEIAATLLPAVPLDREAAARVAIDGRHDPEREALMSEEAAPIVPAKAHNATLAPLLRAASPLAGIPGARPCPACGRGIWVSPSWRGSLPPNLCAECLAQRSREEAQAAANCEREGTP